MEKMKEMFPWFGTFLDKFMKNFPDCSEDLLEYILENLKNEVKAASYQSRKRRKELFETVLDLFIHCWRRLQWKKDTVKYCEKDCLKMLNNDYTRKCVAKLLYFIIYCGILLSEGISDSTRMSRVFQAIQVLPDINIVCSSLLLINNLKKKLRPTYCAILKNILITKMPKCILDPVVYIKVMILFKRLKMHLEDVNEKKEVHSTLLKFQAPSSLIPWMISYNLDVTKVTQKNFSYQLFKKSSKNLFEKLQLIVANLESSSKEERPKNTNHNAESIDSQININSTLNLCHSSPDFDIEENKSTSSKAENCKLKKKRSKSGTAINLVNTLSINEKCNESVNLDMPSSPPTTANVTSLNFNCINALHKVKKCKLKKKKSKSGTAINLVNTLSINEKCNESVNLDMPSSSPTTANVTSLNLNCINSLHKVKKCKLKKKNENDVDINDETDDNLVKSQTFIHVQDASVMKPNIQIPADKLVFRRLDSLITEHSNLRNNIEILENPCESFISATNSTFIRNTDLVAENESMERYSGIARVGFSESQSLGEKDMCNKTVEVSSNELTFPQKDSFLIDCNFVNNASETNQNLEIPSIKLVINLNSEQSDDFLQNRNAGNNQLTAKPVGSNASANRFSNHPSVPQRIASSFNGNNFPLHNCHSLNSRHMQHKIATPIFSDSISHNRNHKSTLIPKNSNSQVFKNCFLPQPKHFPSTSNRSTSNDGSDTPHTSNFEMDYSEDYLFTSTPIKASNQSMYTKKHLQSALKPILAFPRVQNDQHEHSVNDFSQCLAKNNFSLSKNDSLSDNKYKNSHTEIYSDASCDNFSVSTISDISEETDLSFIRTQDSDSPESHLKNKKIDSNTHSRKRTISASSIECHPNTENTCHKDKAINFCNLHYGTKVKKVTSKCRTSNSVKTKTVRTVKNKKMLESCDYNLRPRRSINKPQKLDEYFLTNEIEFHTCT